jgi:iron-sulfur cluster insertion protein
MEDERRFFMFTVTEAAAEKAKEILETEGKPDWGLRVFVAGSSCCGPSYGMDLDEKAKDGDETVEQSGLKVFADKEAFEKLNGMQVDFIVEGEQQGFVIKDPNPPAEGAAPSCGSGGCGSSCG